VRQQAVHVDWVLLQMFSSTKPGRMLASYKELCAGVEGSLLQTINLAVCVAPRLVTRVIDVLQLGTVAHPVIDTVYWVFGVKFVYCTINAFGNCSVVQGLKSLEFKSLQG
jgi:hypothetical protein